MNSLFKSLVLRLSRLPFLGRFIHIAAAVYHLPHIREKVSDLENRVAALEQYREVERHVWNAQFPGVLGRLSELNHRLRLLEGTFESPSPDAASRDDFSGAETAPREAGGPDVSPTES